MAFGQGLATGFLQGLSRNAEQNRQEDLVKAKLKGDILNLGGEIDEQPRSGLRDVAAGFGLASSGGPDIESLTQQQGQLEAKQKQKEQQRELFKSIVDQLADAQDPAMVESIFAEFEKTIPGIRKIRPIFIGAASQKKRERQEVEAVRGKLTPSQQQGATLEEAGLPRTAGSVLKTDKPSTMSQLKARAVLNEATDATTGDIDDTRLAQAIEEIDPQSVSANNLVFDIIRRKATGEQVSQGELDTVEQYKGFLRESAGARARGTAVGRERGKQEVAPQTQKRISREETAKQQGRDLPGLSKQKANTRRVVDIINAMQDSIQANPAILGIPGALSRAITSLADQATAAATLVIPGADYAVLNDVTRYANIFRETGIDSAKLQSQLLGLAIAVASAEGFTGRGVTDRKIQLNLRRLSGAVAGGSAEIAFKTLEQFKQEMSQGFTTALEGFRELEGLDEPLLTEADEKTFFKEPEVIPPGEQGSAGQPTSAEEEARRYLEGP